MLYLAQRRNRNLAVRVALALATTAAMAGCSHGVNDEAGGTDREAATPRHWIDPGPIVDGYRANHDRLMPLRVSWRNKYQFHDLYFFDDEKRVAALEVEAAATADPGKRAAVSNEARGIRDSVAAHRQPLVYDYDFWTDGRAFQVRVPLNESGVPKTDSSERPRFPDEPVTSSNFRRLFGSMFVASWAPAQTGSLRVWNGIRPVDGAAFARISDKGMADALSNFLFPPLGDTGAVDGPLTQRHPLDRFFRGSAAPLVVVGQESLHGRNIVVLRRTEAEPGPEGATKRPGKLELVKTETAWVDPTQGFLPLRIELRCNWALDGKPLGHPEHWKPQEVVEVNEVIKVKDGIFYPRSGTVTSYCGDPRVQQNLNDFEALFAGTDPMPALIPYQVNNWEAYTIEAQRRMAPAMFVPRFPDDAAVFDETQKAVQRAEPMRDPLAPGDAAPQWALASWTDGKPRQLDDFRGKVVLLEFWATWCGPCVNQMPAIETLNKRYDGRVAVVGIHTSGADPEKVRAMLKAKGTSYPSGIDAGPADAGMTLGKYGVSGLPTLILIDQHGKVAWTSQDARNVVWTQEAARKLGIALPPDKDIPAEQLRRVHVALISEQIDKILKQ